MNAETDGEITSQEDVKALLLAAKSGNADAAYELLGKQAPVESWREALRSLARLPTTPDLELVAHRTLRRPPDVVLSLLELLDAVGSSRSFFVATAIERLRKEPFIVERARDLAADLDAALARSVAGRRGLFVRSLSRPRAPTRAAHLGDRRPPNAGKLERLEEALTSEYLRLQELARDVRWRSGSYRHFLRHRLADLALLANVGGRIEDYAYRLLQQRVDDPGESRELLGLVPAEIRSRYVAWARRQRSASIPTARTASPGLRPIIVDQLDGRHRRRGSARRTTRGWFRQPQSLPCGGRPTPRTWIEVSQRSLKGFQRKRRPAYFGSFLPFLPSASASTFWSRLSTAVGRGCRTSD